MVRDAAPGVRIPEPVRATDSRAHGRSPRPAVDEPARAFAAAPTRRSARHWLSARHRRRPASRRRCERGVHFVGAVPAGSLAGSFSGSRPTTRITSPSRSKPTPSGTNSLPAGHAYGGPGGHLANRIMRLTRASRQRSTNAKYTFSQFKTGVEGLSDSPLFFKRQPAAAGCRSQPGTKSTLRARGQRDRCDRRAPTNHVG